MVIQIQTKGGDHMQNRNNKLTNHQTDHQTNHQRMPGETEKMNMSFNHRRTYVAWSLILAMIACLMTGCAGKAATDSAYNGMQNSSQERYDAKYEYSIEMEGDMALGDSVEKPMEDSAASSTGTTTGNGLQAVSSRKLITTVNMETETEHYEDLMLWLNTRIGEYGGYVEFSENYGNQSSRRSATLTIRIPAVNLDAFLTGLSQESNVTYQSRSVKDITLNYVDVQSHKEALLVEQERLMELLEKADNLQDLLTIEERLTYVRYELESYESQLRTYDNQIDYSTIHLSIREVKVLTAPEPEGFWERVTSGFNDNLADVTEDLVEFAIGFLSSIPTLIVWAVILVIVFFILRGVNQIRLNRAARKMAGGDVTKDKKQKSKKRWGKGKKGLEQEVTGYGYAESSSYSQPEKKDGE